MTPSEAGFFFPAEWHPHRATWLSWPHNKDSWPGKIVTIFPPYIEFIRAVSSGEKVCINVLDTRMQQEVSVLLDKGGVDLQQIEFYIHPTNDAWCRDHGPSFVINPETKEKAVINWGYNAWGEKYPPYDLDNQIPALVASHFGYRLFEPGMILEGGSVDFNGSDTILTTTSCLLNPNRNPAMSKSAIEERIRSYFNYQHIIWLEDGIVGDDTDGHIDDITRFVAKDVIVTAIEINRRDENHAPLARNLEILSEYNPKLEIVELPMPAPVVYESQRLPASYANFYIANKVVAVPVFDDPNDKVAVDILQHCFPDREVMGIYSKDIVWGLGSWHCLSQQEPTV